MNCDNQRSLFTKNTKLDTFTGFLVHPTSPVLLTKIGPLRAPHYSNKKMNPFRWLLYI